MDGSATTDGTEAEDGADGQNEDAVEVEDAVEGELEDEAQAETGGGPEPQVLYHEEQYYRLPGLRVAMPLITLLVVGFLVHDLWVRLAAPGPVDTAAILRGVVVPFLFMAAALGFFLWLLRRGRMETTVREDGVHVLFRPFHREGVVYRFDEIEHAQARRFHPLVEYGGWGIRWGWRGKAYLASGDQGVELSLKPRGTVMVGSQDAEGLASVLEEANRADPAAGRKRR